MELPLHSAWPTPSASTFPTHEDMTHSRHRTRCPLVAEAINPAQPGGRDARARGFRVGIPSVHACFFVSCFVRILAALLAAVACTGRSDKANSHATVFMGNLAADSKVAAFPKFGAVAIFYLPV